MSEMPLEIPTKKTRPSATRIACLDYGMARIGVAISDESHLIATPWNTLTTEKTLEKTVQKLLAVFEKHQAEHRYLLQAIVIGMPLLMSGKVGLIADEVNAFIALLKQYTSIPIIPWDERLTSVQADRSLREGSLTRKKRAQASDQVAALIILQNYLDHQYLKKRET